MNSRTSPSDVGVHDVGDAAPRHLLTVGTGGLAPPLGLDADLLAEEGEEDTGLLLAVAGQRHEPLEHFLAVGVGPDPLDLAVVVFDEVPGELLDALGHGAGEPMDGRRRRGDGDELVGVHLGDVMRSKRSSRSSMTLGPLNTSPMGICCRNTCRCMLLVPLSVLMTSEHVEVL